MFQSVNNVIYFLKQLLNLNIYKSIKVDMRSNNIVRSNKNISLKTS